MPQLNISQRTACRNLICGLLLIVWIVYVFNACFPVQVDDVIVLQLQALMLLNKFNNTSLFVCVFVTGRWLICYIYINSPSRFRSRQFIPLFVNVTIATIFGLLFFSPPVQERAVLRPPSARVNRKHSFLTSCFRQDARVLVLGETNGKN